MTRKQVERLAGQLEQLGLAALIGAAADGVVAGTRIRWDVAGMVTGLAAILVSLWLTGLLGGHKV